MDYSSDNIFLSDDLLDFLYQNKNSFSSNLNVLLNIDPYSDTILYRYNVIKLKFLSKELMNNRYLLAEYNSDYFGDTPPQETFNNLKNYCVKALAIGSPLIVIGD